MAVIFDLDGVLTNTAELHYQSWARLTRELGLAFDRRANEPLRGLSRMESLALVLGDRGGDWDAQGKQELADRKNRYYQELIAHMTPADALPGAAELLRELRRRRIPTAVASSSRNARTVLERLELLPLLDAVVDGHDIDHSKPHPQVFLLAADRLGVPPERCVAVEDAESGVAAALAAGMRVVGIGPPERVGRAHYIVGAVAELTVGRLLAVAQR